MTRSPIHRAYRGAVADAPAALAAVTDAVVGIAGDLSLDTVLERLVHAARELVDARYAALGTPDEDGGFDRFITAGMTDEEIESMGPLPRTHGLLGAMLLGPQPYRTDDITADPRFRGWWPSTHPLMRSFLGVPIVFKGDVIGAFYVTDKESAPAFTAADEEMVGLLAAHAAVLMEHARFFQESRELSVLDERNRLARDLHDAMAQTLFSLRLTLEAAAATLGADPASAAGHVQAASKLVETTFRELRTLVFELRPPALEVDGLAETVRKHLEVVGRAHGLAVRVSTRGDRRPAPEVEAAIYRIVQEALTNTVRHARATTIDVDLVVGDEVVTARVRDDGIGFDPLGRGIRARHLGLTSMRERAQAAGGTWSIESSPGSGTTVLVEVPVG
ncbi:MAG: Two-component system sensor histidine kinase [uncultured Acidimicrobiales bacterium]|uniref:Oxygen sensor histidine kinase NreB n=1 Tax=uncultured Acidimicrobiales bacterium TaxID=310071 RepID=A0A6J4IRN0_9ACTN|nr:MAG: Two-component system sensor histidine kinase [uncultured Acidimicrobiales bacterium]